MLVYSPGGTPDRDRFFSYSSYSDEFTQEYFNLGGQTNDLSVTLAISEFAEFRDARVDKVPLAEWNAIDQMLAQKPHYMSERYLAIEELSRDHKVERGFSCLLASPLHTHSIDMAASGLGLAAAGISDAEFEADIMPRQDDIAAAVILLRMALKRFAYTEQSRAEQSSLYQQAMPKLTGRERALIASLADGLRLKQISGDVIPRSIEALNKDIRALKNKLNTTTIEELVMVGIMLGVLSARCWRVTFQKPNADTSNAQGTTAINAAEMPLPLATIPLISAPEAMPSACISNRPEAIRPPSFWRSAASTINGKANTQPKL